METTQVYEKVERTRLIEKMVESGGETEHDIPVKDRNEEREEDNHDVEENEDNELQQVKVELEKGAQDESIAEKTRRADSAEEIPYILHRRHLSEKRASRSAAPTT